MKHPSLLAATIATAAYLAPGSAEAYVDNGKHHTILLRACVVETNVPAGGWGGSEHTLGYGMSAGEFVDRDPLMTIIAGVNNIWAPAGISFLLMAADSDVAPGVGDGIPVIADPDPSNGSYPGDITDNETGQVGTLCDQVWTDDLGQPEGIMVVVARDVISGNAYGVTVTAGQGIDEDPCTFPRNFSSNYLANLTIVDDEATTPHPVEVWAHELGHVLKLPHGDGIDQVPVGGTPPDPGPRPFDSFQCDPTEVDTGTSLMSPNLGQFLGAPTLTPLQIEMAREAASVAPQTTSATCSVVRPKDAGAPIGLFALLLLGLARRRGVARRTARTPVIS